MQFYDNKKLLLRRKIIGSIRLSSKKENLIISSVYISPNSTEVKKNDEKISKFEKNMLSYFSCEIIMNSEITFFFDFEKCKQDLDIDISEFLPIPYLIKIEIKNKDEKIAKKKFILNLITESILNYNNGVYDIFLKKIESPGSEDFIIFKSIPTFREYYITLRDEENWKKSMLYNF